MGLYLDPQDHLIQILTIFLSEGHLKSVVYKTPVNTVEEWGRELFMLVNFEMTRGCSKEFETHC